MVKLRLAWLGRAVRRVKWGLWYEYVARLLGDAEYDFLNFGYLPAAEEQSPPLERSDQGDRVFIELYRRVIGDRSLRGVSVLEVSCGRGGGARYIHEHHHPVHLVAVDRSRSTIECCRKRHNRDRLEFIASDAEQLELATSRFDVVINIEASHAYGDRVRYLREAFRVLKPGGCLLTADFSPIAGLEAWQSEFREAGFKLLESEELTQGVLRALKVSNQQRLQAIQDHAPSLLAPLFRNFAGAEGSRVQRAMQQGRIVYMRFAHVKPRTTEKLEPDQRT